VRPATALVSWCADRPPLKHLLHLTILAAPPIDAEADRTAVVVRLTRNAPPYSRHRLTARYRNFLAAVRAIHRSPARRHPGTCSHYRVRDGVVDLVLHRPVWSPTTRHRLDSHKPNTQFGTHDPDFSLRSQVPFKRACCNMPEMARAKATHCRSQSQARRRGGERTVPGASGQGGRSASARAKRSTSSSSL
jgi:hypothetical protein